jgi:hypothetical protein
MITSRMFVMGVALGISSHAMAETWTCTYPGFNTDRQVVIPFIVKGNKLVDGKWGAPEYDLLENNQYSLIGVDHYSAFDKLKGAVRIFSSTVIIDRTFGHFIYTVGEIEDQPGYRKGHCVKD